MLNREIKKNPALMAMLEQTTDKPEKKEEVKPKVKKDPRKENPQSYKRNRGRGGTKPMSYYLPDEIIRLLNIKAAQEGKTKSDLVLEGLRYVLREEIQAENIRAKQEG